ncbi:mucin-2 [Patella vulgata]|uniref:mucin-2 n=1 Tax=Patella vulgata TaxID=6465 RepID=UPI00217F4A93|nr:mucin-2 [Patella vulgata]
MVDIMIPWVIYIISFLTGLCTGHFMGLNNVTACYTNLDEFLELNCTVSQQIEVRELYFVTKKSDSTDCKPPIANASFFDGCCSYSNDDCAVDVFTASGKEDKYNYILQSCTRRNGCKEKVGWIASHGACNASIYFSYSTYMMARYECIADDLIIANSSDAELTNQVIYLQNGEGTSQVACTVESACGTTVVITAIDVNLTCDAGTINCNHNNDYRIKEILESSDHFLQLEINVTEGHRFWIQLKANDSVSKLTVSCGAKKRNTAQNSCVESTTAITTSDTATSNVTLDTYNVTTTEPATSNVTTPETVTSNVTLDTYNVTTTEPATSDVTAPATSNVSTPVTSNVTTPETINVTTPDTSNVTRPETFNITTPATSNVTTSEQATPNVTTPKTYNVTTPEPTTPNVTTPATATSNVTAPETSNVTTPETFNATIPTTSNVTTPETVTSNVTTTATSNVTTPVISNVTTSETATSNITTPATSNVTTPVTSNVTTSETVTSNVTTTATSNVTTPMISNVTTSETATSNITTPATSNVTTPVTSNVTTSETVTSNVTTSGIVTYNVTTPQQANQESTLPNTSEPDGRTILIIVVSIIGVLVLMCIIPLVVWWCHIKQRKSFYKLPSLEMK